MKRFLPPSATPTRWGDVAAALAGSFGRGAERFAHDVAHALGAPAGRVALTASGRAAFFLILQACKRQRPDRDEVALPAYTCPVLVYAAQAAGLRVRLVEMEPSAFDYDRAALRHAIGPQTLAVVSVHPLGLPRPLDDVRASAHAVGAFFVDDAAQAFGALGRAADAVSAGAGVGALGDAGLLSFGPGKALSAGGGGAALFNDAALAAAAAEIIAAWPRPRLAAQGRAWARIAALTAAFHPRGWWWVTRLGLDAAGDDPRTWHFVRQPLSAPAAALGARLLPRLAGWNEQRRANAQRLLAELPAQAGLTPIAAQAGTQPIYVRLPLLARDQAQRNDLLARLRRAGVGAGRLYGRTLADGPGLVSPGYFPGATEIAQRLLTLPTHPYVQADDIEAMQSILLAESARSD